MSWSDVASAGLAGVLGIAGTLLGSARQRQADREDREREREAVERSTREAEVRHRARVAAEAALDTVEDLYRQFRGAYARGAGPTDQEQVDRLADGLRRQAVYFADPEVQERVLLAADIFGRVSAVERWHGERPSVIAWWTFTDIQATLGHVLRNEPADQLPALDEHVHSYALALEDERAAHAAERAAREAERG